MKIASWNCNCCWNSKNAHWKIDLLNSKFNDIDAAFLMEYPDDGLHDFHGITEVYGDTIKDNRGVGLYLNPRHDRSCAKLIHIVPPAEYAFALGYEITIDNKTINLLGLWNYPKNRKYGETWRALLHASEEFLKRPNSVVMGDFNTPLAADNHVEAELSSAFAQLNLQWVRSEHPTWYFHKDENRPYLLDFCAVTPTLKADLSVGSFRDFVLKKDDQISASDHLPIIAEIR